MTKVCSINAFWIFVLTSVVPGSILHAEDPTSTQGQAALDAQPTSTAPVPPALRQALASSTVLLWVGTSGPSTAQDSRGSGNMLAESHFHFFQGRRCARIVRQGPDDSVDAALYRR